MVLEAKQVLLENDFGSYTAGIKVLCRNNNISSLDSTVNHLREYKSVMKIMPPNRRVVPGRISDDKQNPRIKEADRLIPL